MNNWKYIVSFAGILVVVIFFGLWRLEVAATKSLQTQIDTLQDTVVEYDHELEQCSTDKSLTERVSNDYQNNISNLRRQLDRLRRESYCVPTELTSPPSVPSGSGNQLPRGNGLRSGWLYDFAGRAEQDRLTAQGCITFMDELYKSRGYNE